MAKMIQIRNVPDDLHRRLKVRAAEEGLTLSDDLLRMAEREASRPTLSELVARIRTEETPIDIGDAAARVVRELRGE